QSRVLEDALRERRIPHVVVGGVRFYERKEVRDVLAYLRLVANPRSDVDFRRVLNVPARGLGATTVGRVEEHALAAGLSFADAGLQPVLEGAALVSDIDAAPKRAEAVSLMTLHSAKGLEFRAVFLTGLEDGTFPHSRSSDDPSGLEEERRLCYVGMTRARELL